MIEIVERWTDRESGIDCCSYKYGEGKPIKYAIIVDARQDGHGYGILKDIPLSLKLAKEDIILFSSVFGSFLSHAIKIGIERGWLIKLKD